MSESSQLPEYPLKDPARVVYRTANRTFARLFNERSLDDLKNVVRRKLGLGRDTNVSLKQMGTDTLLDLEDDDDFQAFRVLLKSSVSVDIQVTVGGSQGSTMLPPDTPTNYDTSLDDLLRQHQSQEQPSVSEPATLSESYSRPSARSAVSGESSVHPEVARTAHASATPFKTPDLSARKRKVSFDDAALAAPDKSAERRASRKLATVTPAASAETAEASASPEPVGVEEPPKKKQKKGAAKAKDVQSSPTRPSDTPKSKPKTSAVLDRGSKAGVSTPIDAVTPELPPKKPRVQKRDGALGSKKVSKTVRDTHQSISQPNSVVDEPPLEPGPEKLARTSAQDSVPKTRKPRAPRGTACAAIPRTSASVNVQSEVAAAILSGYLSKASDAVLPEPPAKPKRKYVRKDTKKSSASSGALSVESTLVLGAPTNEVSNLPTERRLEHVDLPDGPPQRIPELNGPPCPICLGEPFHIRYRCPVVLKGPDAIRERLEELKRTNVGNEQSLVKELQGLLRESKVTSNPSSDATPIDAVQSREVSPSPNASVLQTPTIPSNSYVSEVIVESRDEGSSSESSDDTSEREVEHKELPAPRRQQTSDERPSLANDELEAVIRGPAPKRQSILHFIDRIVGEEGDEVSGSEEDEAELEEDPAEDIGQSRRRLSKQIKRSSDSESEDEESRSPSPSRLAEGISDNLGPGVQNFRNPAKESAKRQGSGVVMRDPVNPPVLEGQDDDSEETHVGSEDRMDVDQGSIGEKGVVATVKHQPTSRAPVPPPPRDFDDESQEVGPTCVGPVFNQNDLVPVASETPNGVEADPIEPADDLGPAIISRPSDADPIEAHSENVGVLSTGMTQSTPKPGVTKRIKTRNGQILDDEAERPVLLEQLTTEATDEVTSLPTKGKSRRKITELSASQKLEPTRKSPRFSSVPPSTSTPAIAVILSHKSKVGKAAKTLGKRPEGSQSSAKHNVVQNGTTRITPTPSLVRWEALAEPSSSPSIHVDETPGRIDELTSSSPPPDDIPDRERFNDKKKESRLRKSALPSQPESSQGKERLFNLSSSQIPFPYSQHQNNPVQTASPEGNEGKGTTDLEEEPKAIKKKTKQLSQYRSLSQLASQAIFSANLPTPINKSVTDRKIKKRVADEDSSSSSSSDADEANGSEHIPRRQRAASVLETRKKKKGLSSVT